MSKYLTLIECVYVLLACEHMIELFVSASLWGSFSHFQQNLMKS